MIDAAAEELHDQLARLMPEQQVDEDSDEAREGSMLGLYVVVADFVDPDGEHVIQVANAPGMPAWQIRGLLEEALAEL